MKIVTENDSEILDDVAVEVLLTQARLMAEQIEHMASRPVDASPELLQMTVDPTVIECLQEGRELAESCPLMDE